ncbi:MULTISPECIES: flagellar hook-associated protein FlgL [Comamonas]|jgi:flagellar hook-associated protein 3 FlgL|uniref:flagellar hook-associated protein FlgL n=2 Tax=Comamonadaceae TaxID=80864 RepID=UPI0012C1CFAD|nr:MULTISPECIES: flagellar hook-associated protein FlgL [Comamonas]MDR3065358.1 flagellar hook-associated protein FlgL [Comamonas sp.]MEB5966740.1 flagellar hook-associated protein FlgL [Comamonas testosteroni]MPS93879.1 flagellar hook-associated protein 3 [Comamonas sp.]
MSINRIGTANMYDSTINNLGSRQSSLVDLMEKTTAGKRVLRASDDPVAAAQAERARTRITRSENDQRVLGAQRDVIAQGESELGKAHDALLDFRDLLLQAGNGSYDQVARDSLVQQMQSLREQILGYANAKDSNGLPIFRGLGSPDTPLQSTPPGSTSQLNPGQNTGSDNGLPISLDGHAAWLNVPTGNGVFEVNGAASNSGKAWADVGSVTNPSQVTGDSYTLVFTKDPTTGEVRYEINSSSATATNPVVAATPYKDGQAIAVGGQQISIKGAPADGDRFTLSPSTRTDIFSVLDQAIATVKGGTAGSAALQQGLGRALSELDSGMNRVQAMRSYAGDQLNRADRLESDMKDQALTQEGARSRAEDIDMITALSQVETQKVGLQAALQSYAQMQKLSLFNYIG